MVFSSHIGIYFFAVDGIANNIHVAGCGHLHVRLLTRGVPKALEAVFFELTRKLTRAHLLKIKERFYKDGTNVGHLRVRLLTRGKNHTPTKTRVI